MMKRDSINDVSVQEDVMWSVELGHRAFSDAVAENSDHHRYIAGVSELFYMTDTSDDWSDVMYLINKRRDEMPDFDLFTGVAMMFGHITDIDKRIEAIIAWEKKQLIDWSHEEWVRETTWEEYIANGGIDEELGLT